MACLTASNGYYRFVVLFFNCLLTFGTYFCFDMPSVLQDTFEAKDDCNINDTSECTDGLGLRSDQYNLLYAVYAWTNALVVIAAGFLIDKLGNPVGLFLFSGLCLLGSCLFAIGAMLKGTAAMFPVMLLGRLLFGSGNGSLTIVQNRITAFWFRDKELAFAFGVTLSFSRAGSVLNFFLTKNFANNYGLVWTLWGGTILVAVGFLSAIITSILDVLGIKQLGQELIVKAESKKVRVKDILHFSFQFWLLALTIMFFYNGVFPFVADGSEYIQQKYNFSDESLTPSYYTGATYDVSLCLSPFLGIVIDFIGMRGILALCCGLLTIPVFGILAFTHINALVCTLWLGVTYSFAAASLWPSIPLVVPPATVGTAMGFTTSIQMIGIGVSNLIVGEILGDSDNNLGRWKWVMIFLLGNTICCVTTAALLNIIDRKRGGVLNESRRMKQIRLKGWMEKSIQSIDYNGETDQLVPNTVMPTADC
ncbi:major facilitator superfamily domain-containing protein 1-like isoform X2 [Anneissia japonica]|uniref:major facilitator superfamily domain-containing protein 1-like isoform X2 n=1 Tax=Anneissia japonica TaxID=1529436 RepID=UPI0014258B91|nr:major facilitator superfamily domain-containing protein 1-like isoform X2 [Anneissia japonica]